MEGKRAEKDRGVESTREGKGWMSSRSSEGYKKAGTESEIDMSAGE